MMNILCVIERGTWVETHIVESLRIMGHRVHVHCYGDGVGEFYGRRRGMEQREKNAGLLAQARQLLHGNGLDFIFCYVYDDFLLDDTARALMQLDVPMVNYNVDMPGQWYRQSRTGRYFTRLLCAQRANMAALARYGRVMHFPMAARERVDSEGRIFHPAQPVTFLGTPTGYRAELLARLYRAHPAIAIYGKFWREARMAEAEKGTEKMLSDLYHYLWPKVRAEGVLELARVLGRRLWPAARVSAPALPPAVLHGVVADADVYPLFAASEINLGFSRMREEDPEKPGVNQVKLRDFEVPLAGGFYLMEYAPEYAEYFTAGSEVETWRTSGELIEKVDYFLDHPGERAAIARAGQLRAQRDHTWASRFAMLFAELGIGGGRI